MNNYFQIEYSDLNRYHAVSENHIGMWAVENTADTVLIFKDESDAKLASDFILLMPLMAA
ncbi:hypothetical protein OTK49_02010 [Vibrio coralliirubri]|uniref:hypothetical protein n=1 Tax=Vibrio coralliirubri TaxID=1516159 RepID=UPI002284B398|nr:hypothetical protein [Vibrio coralliirubri]MCY9861289.1 hypothetical protein [Vibrio coralliirubri]